MASIARGLGNQIPTITQSLGKAAKFSRNYGSVNSAL